MFKKQSQRQQARKGNNRWADDEDDAQNSNNNSNKNHPVPSFIKKTSYTNSNTTFNQPQNNTNNYQPNSSSNRPQKDTRFALEKKLIDDILQPTGIKVKPDEKLMVDFCRRAKNLDRTLIYSYLMEKISPYKTFVDNTEKINTLIKCLYLISYIVDSKIEDLFEVFSDNQQIFIDIKSTLGNNKKISELTEQILEFLGVESNQGNEVNDYQNFESGKANDKILQHNESNANQANTNLLDFGEQNNNNGNNNTGNINLLDDIFSNESNNNIILQQNNNSNDLFGGIFGSSNPNPVNNNQTNNNNFPMDIFGGNNQNQNNQNSFFDNIANNVNTPNIINNQNNNQTPAQPKGFNFIKKSDSSNINNGNENKPQAKKGFSFIKQAINSNNNINANSMNQNKLMNNDLNDIFNNNSQPSNKQQNLNNSNQLDNIFSMQSTNNIQENKIPTLVAQKPEFNLNQVYQNTTSLQQGNKANDPFNFVDDLFKKK